MNDVRLDYDQALLLLYTLARQLGYTVTPNTVTSNRAPLTPELVAEAYDSVAAGLDPEAGGFKIKTIKLLRDRTGLGLAETKNAVEQEIARRWLKDAVNKDRP